MPEPADKTTEVTKPKPKPDDGAVHTLTVFAQSLAYSAVEGPMRGLAQIADHALPEHIFGSKLDDKVQTKFNNMGVHKIDESMLTGHAYAAATLGNAVGIVLPMKLSRMTMVGRAEGTFAHAAEGNLAKASILDGAKREAFLSAKTGLFYGAVLTPTENNESSGNFLIDRTKQGFHAATTFGIMGSTAALSSGALGRVAAGLEHTGMPGILKSPLQTALHSNLVHGVIGGIPGGLVQAQLNAMENGKTLASVQEFKDSVISMTAIGGAMGSAGLFKASTRSAPQSESAKFLTTETARPLVDNIAVLRSDALKYSDHTESRTPKILASSDSKRIERPVKEFKVLAKNSSLYDRASDLSIGVDPIETAWSQDKVNQYRTSETRTISFAKEGREARAAHEDWDKFENWGVEDRQVPVDVYRFPGVKAEIVVPSEYARKLDEARERRLNPSSHSDRLAEPSHAREFLSKFGLEDADDFYMHSSMAANDNHLPNTTSILPEELAQMITQMPNPDLIVRADLYEHAHPWDMHRTHENELAAEADGKQAPRKFVANGSAETDTKHLQFWRSADNEPGNMQWLSAHEWSHLLHDTPAYKAFARAALIEQNGFYSRDYAKTHEVENWAVHLGEQFLNPRGSTFAHFVHEAPARALVMSKAVRDMLEARQDNPSPKHAEFLARVDAADKLATNLLRQDILKDITKGDHDALNTKLQFLNTAASEAGSPEFLANVLGPVDAEVVPALIELSKTSAIANETIANRMAAKLSANYSPEQMPAFVERYRDIYSRDAQVHLYNTMPQAARQILLDDLAQNPQLYKTTGLKERLEPPVTVASIEASTTDIVEYPKSKKPSDAAHPFDIKFEPGDNAWPQARIDQYKTTETRSIDFAAPDRDGKSQTSDLSNFRDWGVQSRQVPVDVYRFPGLEAEIVVPSDYARVLDQLRAHRLGPDKATPSPADSPLAGRSQRVLPEEVAQMLAQMPHPDIVKSVELLDHANPNDMRLTREKIDELKAEGKTPPPDLNIRSLADATIGSTGRMRIFESQTNNPIKLQETIAHEWSHIAQTQPAFAGFEAAATADGTKFYARAYAKENIHENWAVHLGERILGPRGEAFAEIPEKAPARTIVMAKALRNMLEERKDNPTPRHAEFMARVQEAENTATTNFQLAILTDIIGGDNAALDTKLRFVNSAALASSSPEMHANILGPIHTDLMKALSKRDSNDQIANSIYVNQLATEVATNYTPETMDHFSTRWKIMSDARLQAHLFKMIPEIRQKELLAGLAASPVGYDRNVFAQLKYSTEGQMQNLVQQTFSQAQSKFEKEGMKLDRANKPIGDYIDWLRASTNSEARMVPLKHYDALLDADQFESLRSGLPPLSTREFVRDGALAYVKPDARPAAWAAILQDLPQTEQVKLFRDLSAKPTSAFSELAKRVEKFDAGEFEINEEKIRDKSFALLQQLESSPEFITAHPRAIKDADAFFAAIKTLNNEQITAFIKDGALDKIPENDQALVIHKMSQTRNLREKLDMIAALEPSFESKDRIDLLADYSTNQDPVVAAKAQRLLIDIADAQLTTLKAKAALTPANDPLTREERMQRHEAFLSFQKLQRKMFEFEDARARVAYLKSTPQDANGNLLREKFSVATFNLPDDQIIKFLKSGIVDRLPPADRTPFLRDVAAGRSNAVKTQTISMELAALTKKS